MHSNAVCNSTLETTKITDMENFGLVLIRIGPMTSHRMTAIVLHLSGQPAYCLCHKPWTKMELQVTPCMGWHYSDIIMSAKVSQITCVSIVCSAICSDADQRKVRVTGLCEGNSPVTSGFPSQRASITESVSSIWWHHHWDHLSTSDLRERMQVYLALHVMIHNSNINYCTYFILLYQILDRMPSISQL